MNYKNESKGYLLNLHEVLHEQQKESLFWA